MKKFLFLAPFFLSLAAIFLLPNLLFSQGQLSIIVSDSDNQPLPGVTVELCSSVLERIRRAITDADGACTYKDLPPGLYQVMCDIAGYRPILRKNIRILPKAEVLKVIMERTHGGTVIIEKGPPPPVDPSIISFTPEDADIFSETSSTLHERIASTWERMVLTTDVCDKRAILKEVLRDWRDSLEKTRNKLTARPQASKKRFMIQAVFDGMEKHIRFDSDSISEFDKNTTNLRGKLSAIANFLKRVSETGKATFDLHVSSFPENTEVTYSYTYGGAVKKHPERTPTTIRDLYFAPCVIIFKQEGRNSVASITHDPFRFFETGIHHVRMSLLDKDEWDSSYKNAPPLKERVSQSDLIIVGEVKLSEYRQNEESSDIYTYTTVAVEECIKGSNILKGKDIVLKRLGGTIKEEGIVHYVERHPAGFSQPGFSKNERILLLLRLLPESKHYEVVAGRHGRFTIMKDDIIAGRRVPLKEFIQKLKN